MRAMGMEHKKESSLWTKFIQWVFFDLTPVLLLLLVMAWAMSLIPAGSKTVKLADKSTSSWAMKP